MFGKSITLFRILGFEVHVDLSWLVLALLVTWSLATDLFPRAEQGLPPGVYWWMGIGGAVGLFSSVLLHEFCHSLVARRFGLPMKGITLFIFGGVAEMNDEPPGPRAEFLIALAGPASSVLLGLAFYAVSAGMEAALAGGALPTVFGYLAVINWVLAAFNLVPAFPLDGGRVLRAVLWHWKKDLRAATRTASRIGSWFGIGLIFLGIGKVLLGNFIGGLWQFMIGMFLNSAAQMSYQQVLVRRQLQGTTVSNFMNPSPVSAPPYLTIREVLEQYVYRHHFKMIPIEQEGRLLGCVMSGTIRGVPQDEWDRRTVREIMDQCSSENAVDPSLDAMQAFSLMARTGKSRLLVVENGRLVGVITLKDIMGYLSARISREEGESEKAA